MNDLFLNALLFLYNTIGFHNLGITILEIAGITRLAFHPMMQQQLHQSRKLRDLQPKLSVLKTKHKGNQQAFAQAQMALYKEHGVNPAAGCLPTIVQLVVLFGLLGALNKALTMDINTNFLIWNMAKPDAYAIANLPLKIPGLLVILAAVSQYFQTKLMMPTPPKIRKEDKPQEKEEKADFMESFAEAQSSMVWMFPLIFLLFGTQWPSGLALYWSASSVISLLLQRSSSKPLPLVSNPK